MRLRVLIATIILFLTMQLEQIVVVNWSFLQTNETNSFNKDKQYFNIENFKIDKRFSVKRK